MAQKTALQLVKQAQGGQAQSKTERGKVKERRTNEQGDGRRRSSRKAKTSENWKKNGTEKREMCAYSRLIVSAAAASSFWFQVGTA
jgi:hypothetical protein